jgi:hypothetical protein
MFYATSIHIFLRDGQVRQPVVKLIFGLRLQEVWGVARSAPTASEADEVLYIPRYVLGI